MYTSFYTAAGTGGKHDGCSMKKIVVLFLAFFILIVPVQALELDPPDVPPSGEIYMPEDTESFAPPMKC